MPATRRFSAPAFLPVGIFLLRNCLVMATLGVVKVQSIILAGVAALLLFGGINGFRKVTSARRGASHLHSKRFHWLMLLQIIMGGLALAGAILFHMNQTDEPASTAGAGKRPWREKSWLATKVLESSASTSQRGDKDDTWRKLLIGTWGLPLEDYGTGEITYFSTGRMSGQITLKTAGNTEKIVWSGKWDVKGGRLCEEIVECNVPDVLPIGRKTKDKILELNEKEFRSFDAEMREAVIWHRIE